MKMIVRYLAAMSVITMTMSGVCYKDFVYRRATAGDTLSVAGCNECH